MLAEYLDGRLDDPAIRRHVEGCDLCRARLRDERLLRVLLGPGGTGDANKHVDDDVLSDYLDQALEPLRMKAVDRHLAHCDRCLASYLELKKMIDEPATAPVSHRVRTLAVEALGVRTLGTLFFSMRGNRVLAFFMAEAEHDPAVSYKSADFPDRDTMGFTQLMNPDEPSFVEESATEPDEKKVSASMDLGWSPDDRGAAAAGGDLGNGVLISVDESLALKITATGGILDIRALDPAAGNPLSGVVVRFEYGEGRGYEQATDEKGRVPGKLPPADVPARIVLPGPPARAIDIQVS